MAILNIDYEAILEKISEWARKAGRVSARPVLLLYYVMMSDKTPKNEKLLILSSISYLIFPIDLISAKRLPVIGWIDEVVSLAVAYQKVCKYITLEMEYKTDALLDKWFPEYTKYEVIE